MKQNKKSDNGKKGMRPPGPPKPKASSKTARRLVSYVTGQYKMRFAFVLFCIVLSAIAGVAGSLFLQKLIDNYITPLLLEANPLFTGLLRAIMIMAGVYLIGIISTYVYNRSMVVIAQGVLKQIRDEMFSHMQTLPVRYFDTHSHGDIMSHYTNDTDTLRQMISMSIPQIFSSIITIVAVFCAMVATSLHLTVLVIVSIALMMMVTKKIGGKSASFFIKQQKSLGALNGYIEEMINGQKVVKVFCHEEKSKQDFDKLNDELCENAAEANKYANIFMPIMANLGTLQYVLIAIAGGALAVSGISGLTIGAIASFLQLSRSFTMPVTQVSQQLNSIVMALAGAERIFSLLDEESEKDEGYVTLINAKYDCGKLTETSERTGLWAWKHPHEDGTVTYTKLIGDVHFMMLTLDMLKEKLFYRKLPFMQNQVRR